jgi:hypothetical protein
VIASEFWKLARACTVNRDCWQPIADCHLAPQNRRVSGHQPAAIKPRSRSPEPAFDALKGRAEALYLCGDPLVTTNRVRINAHLIYFRLGGWHLVTRLAVQEHAEQQRTEPAARPGASSNPARCSFATIVIGVANGDAVINVLHL